jgi:hypothetical protein
MCLRVVVKLLSGQSFELDERAGYCEADLRAAFRIFRRGVRKRFIEDVRLFDREREVTI